jgi:hypothetical protein
VLNNFRPGMWLRDWFTGKGTEKPREWLKDFTTPAPGVAFGSSSAPASRHLAGSWNGAPAVSWSMPGRSANKKDEEDGRA